MQIFGYSWEEIQVKQQGGKARKVDFVPKPEATDGDRAMLAEFGIEGLKAKGFFGVIDRLTTSGLV